MIGSRLLLAALAVLGLVWTMPTPTGTAAPGSETPTVLTARVDGPITPVVADYLTDAVGAAERGGYQALLVELDTPGGLDTSMREIIQSFLGANVPVVVYVTPAGARAASAGALITFSAHVAAMTPGTTIGAATPVDLQGGKISDKVVNDAAAFAESIAAQRGRNTSFAVDTVRQGRAVPAAEAHEIGAIDLLAGDRTALLVALDGRDAQLNPSTTVTLRTAGATVVEHGLGWTRQLLGVLSDPNLAFLFLSLGTLALLYELASPGMGLGGITGAILLIFGFFTLSVLPVNAAGLALLALAAALFATELLAPGIGVAAAGGTVALLLAGLFLFQGPVGVSPVVLWPTATLVGGGSLLAGRLARRAHRARPTTGAEALIGHQTVVSSTSNKTTGRVRLEGTWWTARSRGEPLHEGQQVRVVALEDLTVIVEPLRSKE
jgi:membrane-bound serine protease (ClpP class)